MVQVWGQTHFPPLCESFNNEYQTSIKSGGCALKSSVIQKVDTFFVISTLATWKYSFQALLLPTFMALK